MDSSLSLCRLLEPEIMAAPYQLYRELRESDPVHWDPLLHAWAVTRYADVVTVLQRYSADRTLSSEQLTKMGLAPLVPIVEVTRRQMLFRDPPYHSRVRSICASAFTPARVAVLRAHIQDVVNALINRFIADGSADIVADLAELMPAIVTAKMLGVPVEDHESLKKWSLDFAEILGNFQHNPDRIARVLESVEEMTAYFRDAIHRQKTDPREGLVNALTAASADGAYLTEEEIVANCILTMIGGQETTTNLIGSGVLTLLRHPEQMQLLLDDPSIMPSAVEELLRFESPIQHTARVAHDDLTLGGKQIRRGQSVIAVIAAGNRDPERFPNPDTLDVKRTDNRHLAFGWGAHYCFGAPLARIEGQVAFDTLLRRLRNLELASQRIIWHENLGLRGLAHLRVRFDPAHCVPVDSKLEFLNETACLTC
ncbi:MAG TPA: cytochrome P450 [Bryobacteraceae bacterium]|nr:cytochrome P450 [Bryobacteraceae bacterium]